MIRNAEHSLEDQKLMEATIAMGKNLAFTVVAEGVETEAQARFLRDRNCDKVQSFYFGRPAASYTGRTRLIRAHRTPRCRLGSAGPSLV